MRKKHFYFISQMNWRSRRGFTLTEILLAVMIVGLIAVALASLTRAASREAGVGRSRIMLRNNLSTFARILRNDMHTASRVDFIAGTLGSVGTTAVPLLKLSKNLDGEGRQIINTYNTSSDSETLEASRITYCFKRGSDNTNISPSGAYRGGKIYRVVEEVSGSGGNYPSCNSLSEDDLVLSNVKYINGSYPVPLFAAHSLSRDWTKSLLTIRLITELNSKPIINEVMEEVFAMPMGY